MAGGTRRIRRRLAKVIACLGILFVFAMGLASALIRASADGRVYSRVSAVPHRKVALVLGCSRDLANGRSNPIFENRVAAAAELFAAGKVEHLLVTGDNHRKGYDEATDLKNALVEAGVPGERIECDFAGFRTLDSVVRAKAVFGQSEVTVVSQKFHNMRAIFIARHRGVDAIGFNAREVGGGGGLRTKCREQLARLKAVLDVYVFAKKPRFLGPRITIGGGD